MIGVDLDILEYVDRGEQHCREWELDALSFQLSQVLLMTVAHELSHLHNSGAGLLVRGEVSISRRVQ
eukprot:410870-Rhodomonas_salina.2